MSHRSTCWPIRRSRSPWMSSGRSSRTASGPIGRWPGRSGCGRDLAAPDHRFISQCVFALFRWRGWIEPLGFDKPEERLLLAWLLDSRDRPSGLPLLGPRARPRPGPADGPGRCAELDGAGRRAEEVSRGASRDGRPLAALPPLAPRASPPAAGGRVAQDEICRAAADPADARPALGPRPECRRVQALGRARALGGEALDPSPGDPRGQARARFRRAPPPRLRARRAGDPGPRLAGGGTRLRPRPGRPLVGRLRGGRRQGPPSGRADGGQGGRRRHRHPSLEAQGGRPTRQAEPVPEPDDQGMGRPARRRQAAQLRRRAGRRPLLGHRHLATQSRLPLVDRPPGDPQAGRAPVARSSTPRPRASGPAASWSTPSAP